MFLWKIKKIILYVQVDKIRMLRHNDSMKIISFAFLMLAGVSGSALVVVYNKNDDWVFYLLMALFTIGICVRTLMESDKDLKNK